MESETKAAALAALRELECLCVHPWAWTAYKFVREALSNVSTSRNRQVFMRYRGPGIMQMPMPTVKGAFHDEQVLLHVPEGRVVEVILRDVEPTDNPERN